MGAESIEIPAVALPVNGQLGERLGLATAQKSRA